MASKEAPKEIVVEGQTKGKGIPSPSANEETLARDIISVLSQCQKLELEDAFQGMMEFGFQRIQLMKTLSVEQHIATSWRVAELGGIPLIIACLVPKAKSVGFALTLLGVLFRDANLLNHKLGKMVLKDQFLDCIDHFLKPNRDDEFLPLLAAQVLHNLMQAANSDSIKRIGAYKSILASIVAVVSRPPTQKEHDYRLLYVCTDMLVYFEIAGCTKELEALHAPDAIVRLFDTQQDGVLKGHLALARACLCYSMIFFTSTRGDKDENHIKLRATLREAAVRYRDAVPEEEKMEATSNKPGTYTLPHNLSVGLVELADGKLDNALQMNMAVRNRVRNWEEIEKEADSLVKSSEFERQVKEAQKKLQQPQQPRQTWVVSSDESESEGEGDGKGEGEGDKAVARQAAEDAARIKREKQEQEEKIAIAVRKKNEGNNFFKAERFEDAARIYAAAMALINAVPHSALDAEGLDHKAKIAGNQAECYLRLSDFEAAVAASNVSLEADPSFVKTLMRRAKAFVGLKRTQEALSDLEKILQLEPKNSAAAELKASLAKAEEQAKQ